MPPKAVARVLKLIGGMEVEDQLGTLLVAIAAANPRAINVSLRMLNATMVLSADLSANDKFRIAELLRDAADKLEKPRMRRVVPIK